MGLNSDDSGVRSGGRAVLMAQEDRAGAQGLKTVASDDLDEPTPARLIEQLQPDYWSRGRLAHRANHGADLVLNRGGRFIAPAQSGFNL